MAVLSDIEIAQSVTPEHIRVIAQRAHVDEKYIEQYGNYKAKIDLSLLKDTQRKDGKLVLSLPSPLLPPEKERRRPLSAWLTGSGA